jgi:integrase
MEHLMPRLNLTQVAVERLQPPAGPEAVTHWDSNCPGFGLRVSPKGRKTWVAQYRVKGGPEVLETIATMAILPKVAEARERARSSMLKARDGIDPRIQHRLAADQAKLQAVPSLTFAKLADRFAEYTEKSIKASTARETARLLGKAAMFFGTKPVETITEADIAALLSQPPERVGSLDGLSSKNSLLGVTKRCFAWGKKTINPATGKRYLEVDPARELDKPLKREPSRDRVLSDAEIIAFWKGCDQIGWPFGQVMQLLLVTAQRREEVAGLRWSELDLVGKVWHLPGNRTKNSRPNDIHLSALAFSIIEGLPRLKALPGKPDFVFTTKGDVSVSGFDYAKTRVSAGMPSGPDWRIHDLRRTATTGMAKLRIAPHIADLVLNHRSGSISGVAAVYNRFQYSEERREALELWGSWLADLVSADRAAA